MNTTPTHRQALKIAHDAARTAAHALKVERDLTPESFERDRLTEALGQVRATVATLDALASRLG